MNHGACRDESNVRACFRPARRAILAAPSALCAPSYDDALTIIGPAMWNGLDQNISLSEEDYETIMQKKKDTCRLWQSDHVTISALTVLWVGLHQQTIALVYVLRLEWKILSMDPCLITRCYSVSRQGRRQKIFSWGAFRFHRGAHFFMISETDILQNNLYYYLNWSSSILKHILKDSLSIICWLLCYVILWLLCRLC